MLRFRTVNIVGILLLIALMTIDLKASIGWWWYLLLALAYLGSTAYGSAVLSSEFYMPVRWKGNIADDAVAITFDDGPIPGKTELILNILKAYKAPAAFFCIGHRVVGHHQLVRQMHDAGHLVGNHSYWHASTFDLQTVGAMGKELDQTDKAIYDVLGCSPAFFRPPYGVTNPMLATAVRSRNYTTVGWSVRSFDTVISDEAQLLQRVTRDLRGGDVILLHDHGKVTVKVLPALLDHIRNAGLKIVRVDELLNERAYTG